MSLHSSYTLVQNIHVWNINYQIAEQLFILMDEVSYSFKTVTWTIKLKYLRVHIWIEKEVILKTNNTIKISVVIQTFHLYRISVFSIKIHLLSLFVKFSRLILVTASSSWPLVCMAKAEWSNAQSHQTSSWNSWTVCLNTFNTLHVSAGHRQTA